MRLWWYKIAHWEYWPVYIVYMPTFFLWIWWAIRFRSIKFFKYANPGMINGGLYGDTKTAIYKNLPSNLYPKTTLVNIQNKQKAIDIVESNQFEYPLIVKPNIGIRGNGVQKIFNTAELKDYAEKIQQDFLVQEFIQFPHEIGLFYYRLPNEENGIITGITIKKFLTLRGNGYDTIEQLLKKTPRFRLQIPKIKKQFCLGRVLSENEQICLVPFGNHSRGAEFINGKELVTKKLEQTINNILKNINGFYYGRLDIRFNSFEGLEEGRDFSIIEINGVKSEPTHIYDPKHSFWYGQKEIYKHQKIMKKIVEMARCTAANN